MFDFDLIDHLLIYILSPSPAAYDIEKRKKWLNLILLNEKYIQKFAKCNIKYKENAKTRLLRFLFIRYIQILHTNKFLPGGSDG